MDIVKNKTTEVGLFAEGLAEKVDEGEGNSGKRRDMRIVMTDV